MRNVSTGIKILVVFMIHVCLLPFFVDIGGMSMCTKAGLVTFCQALF